MSRESSAQLDKEQQLTQKTKKSQALIQSKLVSQNSSLSSSIQMLPNGMKQTGTDNQRTKNGSSNVKMRETISATKSQNKSKKIVQLQSERVPHEPVQSSSLSRQKEVAQNNLKSSLMVISSSGVQSSAMDDDARRSTLDNNNTEQNDLSNEPVANIQQLQEAQQSTITDMTTKKKNSNASPQKPTQKLHGQAKQASKESSPLRKNAVNRQNEHNHLSISEKNDKQQSSTKASLKPFIIPKSKSKNLPTNEAKQNSEHLVQQASIQGQQSCNSTVNSNQNQRQLKQIRNSFNNFFVTSKQQNSNSNTSDNKIKFRLSQAEHRNELKNYLELASLAGEHPLPDQHINSIQQQRGSSSVYKRANPLLNNETADVSDMADDGYEAARRESNISQLQALNTANVQLMPALQSSAGFRNHHNRTSLVQAQRSTDQTNDASSSSTIQKQKSLTNKHDKPYQSEATTRILSNSNAAHQSQRHQQLHDHVSSTTKHPHPKFLINNNNRQSPVSLSLASRMQYNDSVIAMHNGAATSSSIVSMSGNSDSVMTGSTNNNYTAANSGGFQKMSNKFISGKLGMLYASAKGQPVRARTNLEKYTDGPFQLQQQPPHGQQNVNENQFTFPSSSSVTTIQMPSSIINQAMPIPQQNYSGDGATFTGIPSNELNSMESSLNHNGSSQGITNKANTPTTSTNAASAISSRKLSSQFIQNTLNSQKQKNPALINRPYQQPQNNSPQQTIEHQQQSYLEQQSLRQQLASRQSAKQGGNNSNLKKGSNRLQASKLMLEPLSMNASLSVSSQTAQAGGGIMTAAGGVVANVKRQQRQKPNKKESSSTVFAAATSINEHNSSIEDCSTNVPKRETSNMMLPLNTPQLAANLKTTAVNSRLSNRSVVKPSQKQHQPQSMPFRQRRDISVPEKTGGTVVASTEQHRRASHQPSSVIQNRITSQMAYRCFSRQQKSRAQSRETHSVVASRQQRSEIGSKGGFASGQGDLGPLPRARLIKQQAQHNSSPMPVTNPHFETHQQALPSKIQNDQKHLGQINLPKNPKTISDGMRGEFKGKGHGSGTPSLSHAIMLPTTSASKNNHRQQHELIAYPLQQDSMRHTSVEDPFETERQLILARGGSLTRKANNNLDDEDDIFNERGGFRIKINKEQKVVNHLEDRVENNNLLFYNFNAYKQQDLEVEHLNEVRDYSGSALDRRKGDSVISNYEAANPSHQPQYGVNRPYSRSSVRSRQDYRQRQIMSAASASQHSAINLLQNSTKPGLTSLDISQNPNDKEGQAMMLTSELRDSDDQYSNTNNNRYKQQSSLTQSVTRKKKDGGAGSSNNFVVPNQVSSASLNTAATTKGSDFGNIKGNGSTSGQGGGGSNTPQRDATGIMKNMNEMVVVPPRPTNSSRLFYEQNHSGTTRKNRVARTNAVTESHQESNKVLVPPQYSIIKASQTSIGVNNFARSAMRLKQKSSRNGMPNRGGSLDGCQSSHQTNAPECSEEMVARAGRTAGGAVWSRMLNMQSVEEGIQEGNVSDEDD